MYCHLCGRSNPTTQTSCMFCGARIKSSDAFWKLASVALVLIAALSWAAFLFSNSISQLGRGDKDQPLSLLNQNTSPAPLLEAPKATPSSREAEHRSTVPIPIPSLTANEPPPSDPQGGNPSVIVWVNPDSRVYHCPGTRWYGKSKVGLYLTQKEALQKGYRPAYGNLCE
jgi:hypothetical protein